MRPIILLAAYFIATPLLILISSIYLLFLSAEKKNSQVVSNPSPKVAYAALPNLGNFLDYKIYQKDARVDAVFNFLKKYNSDLAPFAQEVVRSADKYNVDYRLVPAIAMQESNLCKKAPRRTFNCWGWGIYGKSKASFRSYSHGIEAVSKTLGEYKELGLVEPSQIMTKYTPSNTGAWAKSVDHFMNQMLF